MEGTLQNIITGQFTSINSNISSGYPQDSVKLRTQLQ
jgi:hypothetical protein